MLFLRSDVIANEPLKCGWRDWEFRLPKAQERHTWVTAAMLDSATSRSQLLRRLETVPTTHPVQGLDLSCTSK